MSRALRVSSIVLWVLAPLVLALSLWRPEQLESRRAQEFRPQVPGFELVEHKTITPRYVQLLGTNDVTWRVYRDTSKKTVYVTCVFHESNWKSLHPPHICLRGGNMDILEDSVQTIRVGDRELRVGRILASNRKSNRPYLGFYAFVGRGFVTHSYLGFFLEHAPRALFRSATPGFLIRVETDVDEAGEPAAEERCLRFLGPAISAGEALIR